MPSGTTAGIGSATLGSMASVVVGKLGVVVTVVVVGKLGVVVVVCEITEVLSAVVSGPHFSVPASLNLEAMQSTRPSTKRKRTLPTPSSSAWSHRPVGTKYPDTCW